MHLGVLIFVTERSLPIADLARACEQRGIESLWLPEHPVVPAVYRTRYPLSEDGKLPRPYTELPDQFAVLAAAAAVTTKLRLGTGICLVPERDPLMLAHQVATVDWLSNGRFLFGIGAGWLEEEMRLFTPHFPYRFAFMREAVAAMRALWTEEPARFEGRWITFPGAVCRPKPVQKPHPPILMGGDGPTTFDRVIEFCDGWMPIGGRWTEDPREKIAAMRAHAERRGRDPRTLSITIWGARPDRAALAKVQEAGAERAVLVVPAADRDTVLRQLDTYAALR